MPGTFASLIPTPLHPAVVHLPMALAVLASIFAVGALFAVRRGARPVRSWGIAVAMLLALSASAWASTETGEDQEDRVERVVPEAALDAHADAADTFLWVSGAVAALATLGLLSGRIGAPARLIATAGSAALLVLGYRVGNSGGELVYTHGAASAYVDSARVSTLRSGSDVSGTATASATDHDDDRR